MKIAIMMRAMDQDSGFRSYTEGLVENMVNIGSDNFYLLLYRTTKWFGRFSSATNVKEILLRAPHKLLWDQVAVPYRAWKECADIIFNPKFTVPFISHCPVTMGLQEPAWWVRPEDHERWDVCYMRTMLPLYCRKATHLFPMSDFVLEENRKYLRLALENTTVTYTAPEKFFGPVQDPAVLNEFRTKYQLPAKFILCLTRVDHPGLEKSTSFFPGKNPETAVRAFALCRKEIPHKLVIAGRRVREYLLYKGLDSRELEGIEFIGFVPYQELPKLYSLAELLVAPALYEGFAHTLIQAMVCGCPAIASQTGGCSEVGDGATLLADPNDPADFAAKILAVVNRRGLREDLRAKGLVRAAMFTWERTAKLTLDGLKRAANGSLSARRS